MEVVGFIIIVLVMVGVIIRRWWLSRKTQSDRLSESANKLQLQLEEAADTIIKRMENHVNHLEFLIEEADGKIAQLDEKIKTMEALAERNEEAARQSVIAAEMPVAKPREITAEKARAKSPLTRSQGEEMPEKRKKRMALKPSKVNAAVLAMLKEGDTLDEIAKRTGIGKGAILLIQGMYKSEEAN